MRIRFWDRLLSALAGLLIALAAIGLFVFGIGVFPVKLDLTLFEGPFELWQRAVMVVASVILFGLGVHGISLLFRRGREKGFIIQHTEFGDMSISMKAMESMVNKCVDAHQELSVTSTRIHHGREGVVVDIKIMLAGGVNIPLTVNALQKQIKQYITSCSGVDVHQVRVMVETDSSHLTAPASSELPVREGAEGERSSLADHLCQHTEEPSSYAAETQKAEVEVMQEETISDAELQMSQSIEAAEPVEAETSEPFAETAFEAAETDEGTTQDEDGVAEFEVKSNAYGEEEDA